MENYHYNIPDEVKPFIFEQIWEVRHAHVRAEAFSNYNKISQAEYRNLKDVILEHPNILNVLELGCGIGRTGTYLYNMINKDDSIKFNFCDSNTGAQGNGGTKDGNDYNSLDMTKLFITSNNVKNFEIIDFKKTSISTLPKQDLIISMYSVGVHFPIEIYLNDILKIIDDHSIIILSVRPLLPGGAGGTPTYKCSGYKKYTNWFKNVKIIEQKHTCRCMPGGKYLILNGPKIKHICHEKLWEEYNKTNIAAWRK